MQLSYLEWFLLLLFIALATYGLQFVTWLVRKYVFNIDNSERREILQAEFENLKKEHTDQQSKIMDLEKQNKIFVQNYENVVGRLSELQKKYDLLLRANKELQEQVEVLSRTSTVETSKREKVLYVVVGSGDAGLSLDLASIRAVETETGLDVQHIKDPQPESIERKLAVARREKSHIYLHLSVKADSEGYLIGDKIVDATWLSGILDGVLVLLVAGTDSDYVGEFLGVVPYVVTMRGGVGNREAAIFSRAFWTEIGRGIGPSLALKRALAKSPEMLQDKIIMRRWES